MLKGDKSKLRKRAARRSAAATAVLSTVLSASMHGMSPADATTGDGAIRINSGGGALVDARGRSWLADTYVTGGRAASAVAVTSDSPEVDRSERYGAMTYAIPVAPSMTYRLRVHLTEIYFSTVGQRVFDVSAEGRVIADDKDILASGPRLTTQVLDVPVRATDGRVDLAFANVVNNASVTAIELIPTDPSGVAMPVGNQTGYQQVFADNFSGTSIDTTKWSRYAGVPGSDPGSQWAPSHVTVGEGVAALHTYRDPAYENKWTSGAINNARGMTLPAGKVEVRMRADAGRGLNAVALLWPKNNVWPPEIDFVEDREGDRQNFTTTVHYTLDGVHKTIWNQKTLDMTQWHTYGVEWKPGQVSYTVDGQVWRTVNSPYVPTVDMSLAIQSNAVTRGIVPDATTPERSRVDIDWAVGYALVP